MLISVSASLRAIAKTSKQQKGFTIVELMIALSVLSTVLLMSTVVLTNIGSLYTKGINAANLQNTARNIQADVTSALQFSGTSPLPCNDEGITCSIGTISGTQIKSFCVNNVRYSYLLNREMGNDPQAQPASNRDTPHVMWRDSLKNNNSCPPLNILANPVLADTYSTDATGTPSKGYDVVPEHMRLTRFKIMETPPLSGVYKVDTWMAYGDSDLVNPADSEGTVTCKGGIGTQYCGLSKTSSSVIRRIE